MHELYARGGEAVAPVSAAFPGVVVDGAVDRQALSKLVVGAENESAMRLLESLVHPLVSARRAAFLNAALGAPLAVLDVPLLFETGLDSQCDAVAVVSADAETQRQRVLARPGMTVEKLEGILGRQMADVEKRQRATFVIDTSCSLPETRAAVERIARDVAEGRTVRGRIRPTLPGRE